MNRSTGNYAGCAFWLALSFLVPLVCVASQGDKVSEPAVLQLKISSKRNTFVRGQEVSIDVKLTNVSKRDIFVGRDWLVGNASSSRVVLSVTPVDGHDMGPGFAGAVDGVPPHAWDDLPRAILRWGFLLPGGFSFATEMRIGGASEFLPGAYKIRAVYTSFGVDMDSSTNPVLSYPAVLASLMPFSWKGEVASNEITIRIVSHRSAKRTP